MIDGVVDHFFTFAQFTCVIKINIKIIKDNYTQLMLTNKVNDPSNRYFTQYEKEEIMKLYYEQKMDVFQIADKLDSLPNHIAWSLLRWKYRKNNDCAHECSKNKRVESK